MSKPTDTKSLDINYKGFNLIVDVKSPKDIELLCDECSYKRDVDMELSLEEKDKSNVYHVGGSFCRLHAVNQIQFASDMLKTKVEAVASKARRERSVTRFQNKEQSPKPVPIKNK